MILPGARQMEVVMENVCVNFRGYIYFHLAFCTFVPTWTTRFSEVDLNLSCNEACGKAMDEFQYLGNDLDLDLLNDLDHW